jgi:hypothetical protein
MDARFISPVRPAGLCWRVVVTRALLYASVRKYRRVLYRVSIRHHTQKKKLAPLSPLRLMKGSNHWEAVFPSKWSREALESLLWGQAAAGANVLRIWSFSEGGADNPDPFVTRYDPMTGRLEFNETAFEWLGAKVVTYYYQGHLNMMSSNILNARWARDGFCGSFVGTRAGLGALRLGGPVCVLPRMGQRCARSARRRMLAIVELVHALLAVKSCPGLTTCSLGADFILVTANKLGLRCVLTLTNFWKTMGGAQPVPTLNPRPCRDSQHDHCVSIAVVPSQPLACLTPIAILAHAHPQTRPGTLPTLTPDAT